MSSGVPAPAPRFPLLAMFAAGYERAQLHGQDASEIEAELYDVAAALATAQDEADRLLRERNALALAEAEARWDADVMEAALRRLAVNPDSAAVRAHARHALSRLRHPRGPGS